jgi:hypothetical protein
MICRSDSGFLNPGAAIIDASEAALPARLAPPRGRQSRCAFTRQARHLQLTWRTFYIIEGIFAFFFTLVVKKRTDPQ